MRDMQLSDGHDCETEQGFGPPPGAIVRVLKICNQKGMHARASAKFVQTVEKFEADVRVSCGTETVGGNSILGLMTLSAGLGTEITVAASGLQKAEVLAALECLVNDRFGEDD
jgi:phosphocarrier protein HPr